MIELLLKTSISGGMVILLWFITEPVSKRFFKASWHYAILKFSMLLMVLPLGLLTPQATQRVVDSQIVTSPTVIPAVSIIPPLPQETNLPFLFLLWLCVFVVLLLFEINKVLRLYRFIIINCGGEADKKTLDIFSKCKKRMNIRRSIELKTSKCVKTPFTIGLFNPVIYIPKEELNREEIEFALLHELTHIKNGDLWFKFFSVIISVVHWFNPMVYLLRIKISTVNELYCDERMTAEMSKKKRKNYGRLLLKTAYDGKPSDKSLYAPLSIPARKMKQRLSALTKARKPRKSITILSAFIAIIAITFAMVQAITPSLFAEPQHVWFEWGEPPIEVEWIEIVPIAPKERFNTPIIIDGEPITEGGIFNIGESYSSVDENEYITN
jgi:beta-lactamase regulating signal transducer with metallopeptidase domain